LTTRNIMIEVILPEYQLTTGEFLVAQCKLPRLVPPTSYLSAPH